MKDVTLLEPEAMRARRRPLAVLTLYVWQLAWALVVATPVHAWARRSWGTHPSGDAVLWSPGARELLAWLGDEGPTRIVALRVTLSLFVLGIAVAQLPLGALLASLAFGRDEGRRPFGAGVATSFGVRAFVPLGSLLVVASIVQIATIGVFGLAGSALATALADRLGDGGAMTVRLGVIGLGVLLACAVGALVDIARASAVQQVVAADAELPTMRAVLAALRALVTTPSREIRASLFAWAWRGVLGLVLVILGAKAADALGGSGGLSLVALWLAHQGVVLGRTALRASWLARASGVAARAELRQRPSDL